ncbi:MAG: T9SS type A sorting domain-containing protein [Taibaiella sp.]|nr:T9SS type A sorting domain-containing protein [Taibaiella sp.]
MKKFIPLLYCILLAMPHLWAQSTDEKCGYKLQHDNALARNPNFDKEVAAYKASLAKNAGIALKTSVAHTVYVPVVFHVVLNSTQITDLGGASGIIEHANSQIQVLNEDYNRGNADSTKIPSAFKPLYASVNIKFALAGIDPNGHPTNGIELVMTSQSSYDITSAHPALNAKLTDSGGASSWDYTRYVNVWVIAPSPSGTIGLTCPPSYCIGSSPTFYLSEMGVIISYHTFGRKLHPGDFFLTDQALGRTLTHEMGHYFELLHPWDSSETIQDTPPQCSYIYGCPSFPHTDACSPVYPGIQYMNFLEYTNDSCMQMFSHDQDSVMYATVSPGGESYNLTLHPELLSVPGNAVTTSSAYPNFSIYPNPAKDIIEIAFDSAPTDLQNILVLNMMGQVVKQIHTFPQSKSVISIDLSGISKGIYFVQCQFATSKDTRKIVLQ